MKRRAWMSVAATLLALSGTHAAPAIAQASDGHFYGPAPEWEEYRQMAEAHIRAQLIDPDSARINWLGSYYRGEFKIMLGGRTYGYVACGTVNSKNRMGGYAGSTPFVVVIDYGRVLLSRIENWIDYECSQLQQQGKFPPLPASGVSGAPAANAAGLALRPMPEGAYVSAVTPGSAAASAGLKAGMVITSVNAIPLAGMDAGMLRVIEAAGPAATLTVVGGITFKLGVKP